MQAREVENRIRAFPEFSEICDRNCTGGCAHPLSFATFIYTSRESYLTGNIVLEDEYASRTFLASIVCMCMHACTFTATS